MRADAKPVARAAAFRWLDTNLSANLIIYNVGACVILVFFLLLTHSVAEEEIKLRYGKVNDNNNKVTLKVYNIPQI